MKNRQLGYTRLLSSTGIRDSVSSPVLCGVLGNRFWVIADVFCAHAVSLIDQDLSARFELSVSVRRFELSVNVRRFELSVSVRRQVLSNLGRCWGGVSLSQLQPASFCKVCWYAFWGCRNPLPNAVRL